MEVNRKVKYFRLTDLRARRRAKSLAEADVKGDWRGLQETLLRASEEGQAVSLICKLFSRLTQRSVDRGHLVETIKKTINGKEKSYTLRTPLSAYGIVDAEADAEGGSDSQGGGSSTGSETAGGGSDNTGGDPQNPGDGDGLDQD